MDQPILISTDQFNFADSRMFQLDQYATGQTVDQSVLHFEARENNQQNYFKQFNEIQEFETTHSNEIPVISSIKQENMEIHQSNLPENNHFSNENPLESFVKQERDNLTLHNNLEQLHEKGIMNGNPNVSFSQQENLQVQSENLTEGGELKVCLKIEIEENNFSDDCSVDNIIHAENLETPKKNLPERNLFCEICNLEIFDYNTYQEHRRNHFHEKKFTCKFCNGSFSAAGVKIHEASCEKSYRLYRRIHKSNNIAANESQIISSTVQENIDICRKNPTVESFSNGIPLRNYVKEENMEMNERDLAHQSNLKESHEIQIDEKNLTGVNPNVSFSQQKYLEIPLKSLVEKNNSDKCHKDVTNENSHLNEENPEIQKRNPTTVKNLFCETCNLEILDYNTFTQHRRSHMNEKKFACEICKRCFSAAGLKLHRTSRTCEKDFNCEICNKKFTSPDFLKSHKLNHTEVKKIVSGESNKIFSTPPSLEHHRILHVDQKESVDEVCTETFITPDAIEIHHRPHTGEKPIGCEDFDERIVSRNFCHRLFYCEVCNKRFSTPTSLEIHQRLHTGEKPFGCEVCGKRFTSKSTLISHRHLHENSFICDVCGRSHTSRSNLMEHLRIHTGEKPFGCSVCPKRFRTLSLLNHHIIIHDEEKRFICEICNKSCTNPMSLERHRKIHATSAASEPAKCQVCDLTYSDKYALRRHKRVVHVKAKYFICEICDLKVSDEDHLLKHRRKMHSSDT